MPMRSSSLANNPLAITRELDGRYDVVLQVRDNLDLIEQVAGVDFEAIIAELEAAQDFTGITVEQGETVAWDAVNKILTVPKGDKGDKGDTGLTGPQGAQGIQGPQGIKGDTGLKGDTGSQGPKGFDGAAGVQGVKGDTGLQGPQGDPGVQGLPGIQGAKGDTGAVGPQGVGITSVVRTSGSGTAGTIDTYTITFSNSTTSTFQVYNGQDGLGSGDMSKSVYDTNNSGIVDNAEKVNGLTIQTAVPAGAVFIDTTDHTLLSNIGINTHSQIDTALTRLADTSGTNTGDNATNTRYESDYRASNFTAGINYQEPLVSGTNIKTINGNSIVGSGNISTIQTSVSGNAGTATKLETLRSIAISGDASGSGNFDGSANANIAITLNSNVTREGNTFNGISQLVKTGTDGKLPAIDGSQLTGIDALPSQTGFDGKYLKTDGTVATWESASTGTGLSTFDFVATAGQTVFSIVYVPGNIDVHHNGLLLSKVDYVATNGTSVLLNTEATVSDVISITVYDTFDVANTYTKGEIDLVIGNINAALDTINGEVI